MIKDRLLKLIHKDLHPLNGVSVRLMGNKWFPFAEDMEQCVSGNFKLIRVRTENDKILVDIAVRILRDQPTIKLMTEEENLRFREGRIKCYVKSSDLSIRLRLIGIKNYKIGKIKIV